MDIRTSLATIYQPSTNHLPTIYQPQLVHYKYQQSTNHLPAIKLTAWDSHGPQVPGLHGEIFRIHKTAPFFAEPVGRLTTIDGSQ